MVLLTFLPSSQCNATGLKTGVEEKLGRIVPRDLTFFDETGSQVSLETLIKKPTIISLVYFSCSHTCPLLLGSLAESLGKMGLDPGNDYQVLTLSFDEKDRPQAALQKKKNYLAAAGSGFPEASWRFLTGSEENIRKLTEAVGFPFKREKGGFSHPKVLVFLSGEGKVVRYLYGTNSRPFDIRMALAESAEGQSSVSFDGLLLFSYRYDSGENRYFFNLLKVLGAVLLFTATSLSVLALAARHGGGSRKKGVITGEM